MVKTLLMIQGDGYGSIFKILDLDVGEIRNKELLYCHLVQEPFIENCYKINLISNKIILEH